MDKLLKKSSRVNRNPLNIDRLGPDDFSSFCLQGKIPFCRPSAWAAAAAAGTTEGRFARGVSDPSNFNHIANGPNRCRTNSTGDHVSGTNTDGPERGCAAEPPTVTRVAPICERITKSTPADDDRFLQYFQ